MVIRYARAGVPGGRSAQGRVAEEFKQAGERGCVSASAGAPRRGN